MVGGGARGASEISGGGISPPPSSPPDPAALREPAAVVTMTSSPYSAEEGDVGEPRACGEHPLGGSAVLVAQKPEPEKRKGEASVPGAERGACVVVDVGCRGSGGDPAGPDAEEVCRICHLSPDCPESGSSELIRLGCGCKGQLGTAHQRCAEAWFRLRGNRYCEICGMNAKNITGKEDGSFMQEWHERRMVGGRRDRSSFERERGGWWRGQPYCNLLMACLVIGFILSWFFRMSLF